MKYSIKSRRIRFFIVIAVIILLLDYGYVFIRMLRHDTSSGLEEILGEFLLRSTTNTTQQNNNHNNDNNRQEHNVVQQQAQQHPNQDNEEEEEEDTTTFFEFYEESENEGQQQSLAKKKQQQELFHHQDDYSKQENQKDQRQKELDILSKIHSQWKHNKHPHHDDTATKQHQSLTTTLRSDEGQNEEDDKDIIDLSKYYYYYDNGNDNLLPPTTTTTTNSSFSNNNHNQNLPPIWFQSYLNWHSQQLQLLNETTWENYNYLVIRCLKYDKCGGTADRLVPVITLIRIASQTQRLFFIYWERPGLLHEYLIPPVGGLNWIPPTFLIEKMFYISDSDYAQRLNGILLKSKNQQQRIVRTKYQSYNYGSDYYNQQRKKRTTRTRNNNKENNNENNNKHNNNNSDNNDDYDYYDDDGPFEDVFASIWYQLFTPSPSVVQRIYHQWKTLELVPGEYVSSHVRALYAAQERENSTLEFWTQNALDCASHFRGPKGGSIYFASDDPYAHTSAVTYGASKNVRVVVSSSSSSSSSSFHGNGQQQSSPIIPLRPLHLDKDVNYDIHTVADFYDTFVDLYLLAHSKCIIRGRGGYGKWASMLMKKKDDSSKNYCDFQHQSPTQQIGCDWDETTPQDIYQHQRPTEIIPPMFVAPMGINSERTTTTRSIIIDDNSSSSNIGGLPKLQTILDQIFIETGQPYIGDLWEVSQWIPSWMKEYFAWHKQQRLTLTSSNWESRRFLVMLCLDGMGHCGGTADRLKSVVFLIRLAHESQRILLIHWTIPAKLEEFLVPPQGGIDWRVPTFMQSRIETKINVIPLTTTVEEQAKGDERILGSRIQSISGEAEIYNEKLRPNEFTLEEVYHDAWRILFTPSKPVASLIQAEMDRMELVPGEYAAGHLRALYGREDRKETVAAEWTKNGLNCASMLRPGGPFLFASDHTYSTTVALKYGLEKNTKIVSRIHDKLPLHLEKVDNGKSKPPSEFYDIFVDLYLMGMSRCLTYNRGGFGQWALLIGYNSTCQVDQKTSTKGIGVQCNWTEPKALPPTYHRPIAPLFQEAMEVGMERGQVGEGVKEVKHDEVDDVPRQMVEARDSGGPPSLPQWMINYFQWHSEQVKNLTKSNWNSTKYLVMFCSSRTNCGGISDRLKPLPFLVLLASRSRRVLMILWMRPAPLEEYFLPPVGGLDWRVPDWLKANLLKLGGPIGHATKDTVDYIERQPNTTATFTRIQVPSAGQEYYDSQPDAQSTYETVFHHLFRTCFTPSPRLEVLISSKMKDHNLVPGQYASAHLRAMYGNRKYRDPNETIALTVNAVNCASHLLPGGPVYFASDIKFAVHVAQEYGRQRSLPVVSLDFEENPIHIDKDTDWKKRDPSAYDDTFVDLLMLGQSQCVAYSNGGYGLFGSLLSFNSNCTLRHFQRRKIKYNCTWTDSNGKRDKTITPPDVIIPEELLLPPP